MKLKNQKVSFIYYILLYLLLLLTWARTSVIPMSLRIAYMVLVFLPLAVSKGSFYFSCLVLFLTTSLLSIGGYTFLPTETKIYVLLTLVFVAISPIKQRLNLYPYVVFIILCFLTLVVNLITSSNVEKTTYALVLMVLWPLTISRADRDYVVELLPKMFILATLACAVMTLLNRDLLLYSSFDQDRLVSGSLNYTCCTMGIGVVLSLRELLRPSERRLYKMFYVISIMIILVTIIMEASRGAILAIAAATVVIILFHNKGNFWTKTLLIALIAIFIYVLYNNQYFDLLISRVQNDDGSGSHRTEIWLDKLTMFVNDFSPVDMLFGIGFNNTWGLGGGGFTYIGCHNDYVAFLIEYGLMGLSLYLMMVLYPFFSRKFKASRSKTLPLLVYFLVVCLTLEPLSMGYLPFYFLLLYMYLEAMTSVKTV